jgi:Ser/Thr protein kinase RdoA (MazF antagonist)/membrane-associated phospholipid phosphatase
MKRFLRTLIVVLAGFVLLWASIVFWEIRNLRDWDARLAQMLNGLLNRSETLDLTVLFFALDPGDIVLGLLGATVIVFLARRQKHSDAVKVASLLGFLVLMALLSLVLVEILDDYVRRPGPAVEIAGFRNAGALLNLRFEPPHRSPFPSERVAIATTVLFLCLFRFGSRSLLLLPLVLFAGAVRVACGFAWPSDVLGGLLLGWLVASLVYVTRLNAAYNVAEHKLAGLYHDHVRVRLSHLLARLGERGPAAIDANLPQPDDEDEEPFGDAARAHAGQLDEHRELLRTHWGFESVDLLHPPHKGRLYPIAVEGRRYAFKRSRTIGNRKASLTDAVEVAESLRAQGILHTAPIVRTRGGDLIVHDGKRQYYIMEWIAGRPVDVGDAEQFRAMMRTLARLHAATERPLPERPPSLIVHEEIQRLRHLVVQASLLLGERQDAFMPTNAEVEETDLSIEACLRSEFIARFAQHFALEDRSPALACWLHGDTHPMNFRVAPDGTVHVLDFDRFRLGVGAFDLVFPLNKFLRRFSWDADRFDEVFDEYLAVRSMPRWEMALLLARLSLPPALLKAIRSRSNRLDGEARQAFSFVRTVQYGLEENARARFLEAVAERRNLSLLRSAMADSYDTGLDELLEAIAPSQDTAEE